MDDHIFSLQRRKDSRLAILWVKEFEKLWSMAPIDPAQLLKALDSLLSKDGGIKSIEDVPRLASLMKKFSKKLVSRCVYTNVLLATAPEILSEYLDKGGWDTINKWLDYAKSSSSPSFLIEMLKLCKLLPMSVSRLKENNTAKLVKSLTKHENNEVKTLSSELVSDWMIIIKGKKSDPPTEKKKKKTKHKAETDKKEEENVIVKPTNEVPKSPTKSKGIKRPLREKDTKEVECYEDVKIDPVPLMPVPKKPKTDRPKTAKLYQKKFRATGLEEATPLPKKITKKAPTLDKSAVVAAAKNALRLNSIIPERITEKKLKPENLAIVSENLPASKGIKLIPAKPRPTYMLHESASFIDALTSQPSTTLAKRKKKGAASNKLTNSPTSPTIVAPKLQFYKDTLEMNTESDKSESEKENTADRSENSPERQIENSPSAKDEEPMEVSIGESGRTPPNIESDSNSTDAKDFKDMEEDEEEKLRDPNEIRSILSHGRRRGKKKSVKWVEDENIKEIFYFELDETERVNVLKTQNFGDMKSIDLKREREAIELVKRQAGDRMEEATQWWIVPILIDLTAPLIEPGYQSKEREIEKIRQQTTLQEIYFTREMIPDSPHEPDLEIVPPQEPKVIPLDEENVIGPLVDYSNYEPPKSAPLPEVLSSLMKINTSLPNSLPLNHNNQIHMENVIKKPLLNSDGLSPQHNSIQLASPYDPAEPLPNLQQNSLLGPPPPLQNMYNRNSPPLNENHNSVPQNEWKTPEMVQDQFYGGGGGYGMNSGSNRNIRPEPPNPTLNMRPRIMQDNFRLMHKGPPRGMGPRPRHVHRVPCRHFIANGCRFGMKCSFLHPGVNGPPL
ncbi:hypothetical protein CDAR_39612 [Caerostris darwini]|uniref:Serine/threonine-protein phosphatase 1 regulatory subunit 10 n=1 Tax=Caerostris darwini TaxID=1538125 RepID=A0AAV4U6H2_9ARAC|nr:hypothetical protein CDAR_39612 [Caerostris darwini]